MTLIKMCGITNAADAHAALEAGADMLGFHFCPSRRRVSPDVVAAIIRELPRSVTSVGVFIDASPDETECVADFCGLGLLQLHGSEPPDFRASRAVMKVLKVRDGTVPDVDAWPDPIMLDSWSEDQRGGTGITWDWELARDLVARRRVFIAGGLRPDTVGELVNDLHPYGVDVSSGVEAEVGRKDPDLMRRFVEAVREADGGARA